MAARETGIGAVETFMHAGKLLALDLLVKVLEHQGHTWSHVRQEVRLVDLGKNVQICLLFHFYFSKQTFPCCISSFCCVLSYVCHMQVCYFYNEDVIASFYRNSFFRPSKVSQHS